jgi:hypothetical protein
VGVEGGVPKGVLVAVGVLGWVGVGVLPEQVPTSCQTVGLLGGG